MQGETKANTNINRSIWKVKETLDKLSTIMGNDRKLHQETLNALLKCHVSSSSESSDGCSSGGSPEAPFSNQQPRNNTFNNELRDGKYLNDGRSNCANFNMATSEVGNELNQYSQQSDFSIDIHNNQKVKPHEQNHIHTQKPDDYMIEDAEHLIDQTIKKQKPIFKSMKKKQESQISTKPPSKLKNVKSEKKILKRKVNQFQIPKSHKRTVNSKTLKQKLFTKTTHQNKLTNHSRQPFTSVTHSRGLQSKYHLNLKKQASMKITDLTIHKILCQKESQYLGSALKLNKQQITKLKQHFRKVTQYSQLRIYTLKSVLNFFGQFQQQFSDLQQQILTTIHQPSQLIQLAIKFPDILRRKNILSQQKCKQLIQDYIFLQNKLQSQKIKKDSENKQKKQKLQTDKPTKFCKVELLKSSQQTISSEVLFNFISHLYEYVTFLLQNNMVHQTKRKNIFTHQMSEFFSDRSAKEKKNKNISQVNNKERRKDYDTERKVEKSLKRTNTSKLFSPKLRTKKDK